VYIIYTVSSTELQTDERNQGLENSNAHYILHKRQLYRNQKILPDCTTRHRYIHAVTSAKTEVNPLQG